MWKLWKHLTIFQLPVTFSLAALGIWLGERLTRSHCETLEGEEPWQPSSCSGWVTFLFVFFWGGGFWVEVLLGKGDVYVKLDTFFVVIESLSMIVCWFSFFVLGKFVDDAMAVFLVRCTAWHTSKPCLHVHVAWLPCKQKSRQPLRDTGCCGVQKPYIEFCFALLSWSWKLLGAFLTCSIWTCPVLVKYTPDKVLLPIPVPTELKWYAGFRRWVQYSNTCDMYNDTHIVSLWIYLHLQMHPYVVKIQNHMKCLQNPQRPYNQKYKMGT